MKRRPPEKLSSLNVQDLEGLAEVVGIEYLQELLKVYVDDAVGRLAMLSNAIEQGETAFLTVDDRPPHDTTEDEPTTVERNNEQPLDLTSEHDVQEVDELLVQLQRQFDRIKTALGSSKSIGRQ